MLSDEEKEEAWSETEIRFRADLLILNSEFPTHRKTEAMEELLEIYNKQSKEIEELNYIKRCFDYCAEQKNKKWEDKIKATIEELDENGYWDFLEKRDEEKCKDILQSLLEKE